MKHAKSISIPLGGHFKLRRESYSSKKEKENISLIFYYSVVRVGVCIVGWVKSHVGCLLGESWGFKWL